MTPEEACKLLNDLTDSWTLDFGPEAFYLYFKDKRWLFDRIAENVFENVLKNIPISAFQVETDTNNKDLQ